MRTEKNINFLLILPFFYPHKGGSQKYAEELLVTMRKKHQNINVDVLCYNTDKAPKEEVYRKLNIHRVPCFNLIPGRFVIPRPIPLILTLRKLARNKYDFINTHIRFFDTTWWVWLYARIIGAKSIFTGHVPTHPIHQSKVVEFVAKLVDLTLAKLSLKFYDEITFVNKASKKFFRERLGVKKDSSIFYIGVDTAKYAPTGKDKPRRVPIANVTLNQKDLLITYVGRVIWTKGSDMLYEVAKNLIGTYPNIYFAIAGPGKLENELKERSRKDKVEDRIFVTGNLTYQQVIQLLSISDVFVNPSHHNEGLPNTLLEAGSSGNLVIATDVGGTTELITNKKTGLLIKPKDKESLEGALKEAIDTKELRTGLANNLRSLIKDRFEWKLSSEKFYEFLTKVKQ